MVFNLRRLVFSSIILFATAQGHTAEPKPKAVSSLAEVQSILFDWAIDTEDLPRKMSLAKYLAALETKLPKDKKIAIRIDAEALSKQLPMVADSEIHIWPMKGICLATCLRIAFGQVDAGGELDWGVRPGAIVITRPRLAAYSVSYDVRDIIRQENLLANLKKRSADFYREIEPTDHLGLLVRLLANYVKLRPWESVEALNGMRLDIVATPVQHDEIDRHLSSLRHNPDLVVMNARLYEVDKAFYTKHVTPLFVRDGETNEQPVVRRIDGPLFKKIAQQKLLVSSDDIPIKPGMVSTFLAKQSMFRFAASPIKDDRPGRAADRTVTGTGLSGVSLDVKPLISSNRRFLRLEITQKVAQLIGIEKTTELDVATGKKRDLESPNLRRTSVTGTVQIPEGTPILMPVNYQAPGEKGDDKVWLLLARPFVWIEAEVNERREAGEDVSPKAWWDSDVPKEEAKEPKLDTVKRLPANDDVREVLEAVIKHVLTDPDLKHTRDFYGTARDKTFTLEDSGNWGWPKGFRPETHGFKLIEIERDPFVEQRRLLGIRIDKFDLKGKAEGLLSGPIEICVYNAGGSANGGVIGGCSIYYVPKRVGKRWTVECQGLLDP